MYNLHILSIILLLWILPFLFFLKRFFGTRNKNKNKKNHSHTIHLNIFSNVWYVRGNCEELWNKWHLLLARTNAVYLNKTHNVYVGIACASFITGGIVCIASTVFHLYSFTFIFINGKAIERCTKYNVYRILQRIFIFLSFCLLLLSFSRIFFPLSLRLSTYTCFDYI